MEYYTAPLLLYGTDVPAHDPSAQPCDFVEVERSRAITVNHAKYRNATVSATFLLPSNAALPLPNTGTHKIKLVCLWFGYRLKTTEPHFAVDMATAVVHENYVGLVATNLSNPSFTGSKHKKARIRRRSLAAHGVEA